MAWTLDKDALDDKIWKPSGDEKTGDWMALHGTTKKVNDEIKALVKRCKCLMFEKEGYKVSGIILRKCVKCGAIARQTNAHMYADTRTQSTCTHERVNAHISNSHGFTRVRMNAHTHTHAHT